MNYAKEFKLVRVQVVASMSGASELDMKVPERRHYNALLVGPFIYNLTFGTAKREKGDGVELNSHYSPVQI